MMASNEWSNFHPKDSSPKDYLIVATFDAGHQENQLILQGIQVTLNRIAVALNFPLAQGDDQPPVITVRNNPIFRKVPSMANRRFTPDDSESSDKEVEDIIV